MVSVREAMSTDLVTVEPGSTVAEAATIMGARHVGSSLIVQDGRPIGIFTERDILRALAAAFDAPSHPVADWMTPDPVTIGSDADVLEARDLMLERGFRHLPVLDRDGLIGIVSLRDLSRVIRDARG